MKPPPDTAPHACTAGAQGEAAERLRLEREARHFQSIIESSEDAIVSKSLDSVVTSWNAGAQAMFGYRADEMLGRPITLLLPPDRLDEEERILKRLRAGERVDHFETVRVRKDGTPVHVSVTISPIRDPQGQVVGASNIARNINEKKALEAQLLLTASVFTHTNEGIVVIDSRGAIVEVNPAFTHITGYPRQELLGQVAREFVARHDMADLLVQVGRALKDHGHYQGEHWSRRQDHRRIAVLLTVSLVRNAQGEVQNYVALVSDVTPLRVRQEQMEHLAHHDALTDLPNRVLLADRIHQSLVLAQRQGFNVAVLYIDLDGFKQVNDQYGHAVGDALLVALSRGMKEALRAIDTLARIGGDEFAAVLSDVKGMEECQHLLQRLLDACSAPVALGGRQVQVSASIGVALYPQDDVSAEELLRHADRAMYRAKQAGKNQFRVFEG
jgi:diguanylate cyclase (GGDEF)-like protein/PAS domain S-box-containing protein